MYSAASLKNVIGPHTLTWSLPQEDVAWGFWATWLIFPIVPSKGDMIWSRLGRFFSSTVSFQAFTGSDPSRLSHWMVPLLRPSFSRCTTQGKHPHALIPMLELFFGFLWLANGVLHLAFCSLWYTVKSIREQIFLVHMAIELCVVLVSY